MAGLQCSSSHLCSDRFQPSTLPWCQYSSSSSPSLVSCSSLGPSASAQPVTAIVMCLPGGRSSTLSQQSQGIGRLGRCGCVTTFSPPTTISHSGRVTGSLEWISKISLQSISQHQPRQTRHAGSYAVSHPSLHLVLLLSAWQGRANQRLHRHSLSVSSSAPLQLSDCPLTSSLSVSLANCHVATIPITHACLLPQCLTWSRIFLYHPSLSSRSDMPFSAPPVSRANPGWWLQVHTQTPSYSVTRTIVIVVVVIIDDNNKQRSK